MIDIIPCVKLPDYQEPYCVYVPNIENDSMAKKLNRGIEEALKKFPEEQVFCVRHDDTELRLRRDEFDYKVSKIFENKNIGCAGVIGCCALYEECVWWVDRENNGLGQIIQGYRDIIGKDEHGKPIFDKIDKEKIMTEKFGVFDYAATCDGCCMFFPRRSFEAGLRYDENLEDFHFYDADICVQCLSRGWKVAISDALIYHKSMGLMPKHFSQLAQKFHDKWDSRIDGWPITRFTKFKA